MCYLAIPLLLLFVMSPGSKPPEDLADFSRFSQAINQKIAIVERDGTLHEGVLTTATGDDVKMRVGSDTRSFARADVMSAERSADGRKDGAIKGAIFGAVLGLVVAQSYDGPKPARDWVGAIAVYAGIGWALDAAQSHREPIYRSMPVTPSITNGLKITLRF